MNKKIIPSPLFSSKELLEKHPYLIDDKSWLKFVTSFDATEAYNNRVQVYRKSKGIKHDKGIDLLKLHAKKASQPLIAKLLKGRGASKDTAAKELGEYFLKLIESPDDVKKLLQKVQKITSNQAILRGYKAQIALAHFIEREERLPSKKELNLETYRWENAIPKEIRKYDIDINSLTFGGKYDNFRFLDAYEWEGESYYNVHLVPESKWADSTFDSTSWSKDIIKPLGFSALPTDRQI